MYTRKYLVKRISMYALALSMAITINFVVPRLIPGNPVQTKLMQLYRQGIRLGGQEFVEKYSKLFSLDQPMHVQFINYITMLAQGNLGFSISYFPATVLNLILTRLPWTIGLLGVAVVISFVGGLLLGAFMGWTKREGKGSKLTSVVFGASLFLSQMPFYLLGMMFVFLLTYLLPLFPYGGGVDITVTPGTIDYVISILYHGMLPALSIVLVSLGAWAVEARGLMVTVLGEDYLFLAKAKGLRERYVFRQYALKNTLLPTVTDLALSLGAVTSGSIITEIVFTYPGVGSLLYNAVTTLDYPLIQGITLMLIFGVTTSALLIDLIYPFMDPRVGEK